MRLDLLVWTARMVGVFVPPTRLAPIRNRESAALIFGLVA